MTIIMKEKRFFLFSVFILLSSILSHLYLSAYSFSLKAGMGGLSGGVCDISSRWSCSNALASDFSEIAGVPISLFGTAFNAFCLFILLFIRWGFVEKAKIWSDRLWQLSLFIALISIVMLLITLIFLDGFCPGCTLVYALSFLVLWPLKKTLPSSQIFPSDFFSKESLQPLMRAVVFISILVFVLNAGFSEIYPVKKMESLAQSNFLDWQRADTSPLPAGYSFLSSGPEKNQALFTVIEFADFLCSHCKKAYFELKAFQKIHSGVRYEFYNFPLNSKGCKVKGRPLSPNCYLARAVFCAEKRQAGALLKDAIFTRQEEFSNLSSSELKEKTLNTVKTLSLSSIDLFSACVESEESFEAVSAQIEAGRKAGVQGTPSFFVEGKKLGPQALQVTLKKIHEFFYRQGQ